MVPRLPCKSLVFDLGNTLIYFDADQEQILARQDSVLYDVLSGMGLELDRRGFSTRFRTQMGEYFRERDSEFIEYTTMYVLRRVLAEFGYSELPEDALRPALAEMYAVSQAHWKPEQDAIPTLARLQAAGYRLGMVSNAGDDDDVQRLVDQNGLRPYFQRVITSAALGVRKPNPRIFRALLDEWGTPPAQAVMVGDTLGADILGAQNTGMYSIWITRRADTAANRAHADTITPDAKIGALSELPALLSSLQS